MKSSGSRVSKKTTTSLSKRQEEDANPTFLNCSHYDKLIRIHSMLATLAEDATKSQIKSAFVKSLKSKKMNKKILGEFVELVA